MAQTGAVAGAIGSYVTVDGGARWAAWPLLAGATALCVGETDDGDPRLFAAVGDGDRALLITARVASDATAVGPTILCDVTALLPRAGDDDAPARVERVVAVDRAVALNSRELPRMLTRRRCRPNQRKGTRQSTLVPPVVFE